METPDPKVIRQFVAESREKLLRLDRDMVELGQRPEDADLRISIFRTIHTIKGTCGFLGYHGIAQITYYAEMILAQVRKGERKLTPPLIVLILETADAVRTELTSIETTFRESGTSYTDLLERQQAAAIAGSVQDPGE
jgi:two-component system chemotaxis sensor kinase CheA